MTQLTGECPQVMINVFSREDARDIHRNAGILQGRRIILPVDDARSVVIYANTVGDWNTVAAIAKLYVTTDILPFIEYNLPKTIAKLAQRIGVTVLWVVLVTITAAISYNLVSCKPFFSRSASLPLTLEQLEHPLQMSALS